MHIAQRRGTQMMQRADSNEIKLVEFNRIVLLEAKYSFRPQNSIKNTY